MYTSRVSALLTASLLLVPLQRNLIGITSLSTRDAQGLNFAIPAAEFWK